VELTEEQGSAVDARERAVFCEAGAGSGKTRVLVERYCGAVAEDGFDVDEALAFTFTERAAAELRHRVRRELMSRSRAAGEAGDAARRRELASLARATERSWVMTIHGFCRRLLGTHPLAAGLDPRFRVLDEPEAARLRERAIADALAVVSERATDGVARALAAFRPYRIGQMAVDSHERLRSQGMAEPRLPEVSDPSRSPRPKEEETKPLAPAEVEAAKFARAALEMLVEEFGARYRALKQARSALDFADLELEALALLRRSEPVAEVWRGRFAHVMVDEFQDTNHVQLELVEALRGPETRVFVVGDEQQSIYRFRNADLEVFRAERRRAEADAGTDVLGLRGNFRSSEPILATVNAIGSALLDGYKPLTGGRPGPAAPVELLLTKEGQGKGAVKWEQFADAIEESPPSENNCAVVAEARALAHRLRDLVDDGEITRGETVVLLRAFTHVDAYEDALERAGLDPYVVGGRGYWSQQQVEDLIRLLAVIANPLDDEMLFGALASPAVGVSPDALWLLRRAVGEGSHVWPVVLWRFGGSDREPSEIEAEWLDAIDPGDRARLEHFCTQLAALRATAPVVAIEELIESAMDAFDYDLEFLARRDGIGRMANVRKLMKLAREFERNDGRDLAGFVAAAEASTRRDEREGMAPVTAEGHDGVRVMTVHAAKGLEFEVVAVPDLARGLAAGHRNNADVLIDTGRGLDTPRFGMRLAFPTEDSTGLWELFALNAEESSKESEEGSRLVYVATTRARRRLILSGIFKESDLKPADETKPNDSPLRRFLPELSATGWDGGDADTESPPLSIRVSEPGEKPAAELSRRRPRPAEPGEEAGVGEPIEVDLGPRTVPVGHLSYTSLADFERCGYRFYAERVLGLAPGAVGPAEDTETIGEDEGNEAIDPPDDERASADRRTRSLAFGNAVHAALEWSARNEWQMPPDQHLEALFAAAGSQARERARGLISGWLESSLRAELAGAEARPEVPFALPLGGTIVRGKIDLLAATPAGSVVVDFKTDRIGTEGVAVPGEHYRAQRELYALVAADASPAESAPVRAIHLFLDAPEQPIVETMGPLELDAARERLAGLVRRMREGDYTPTDEPTLQVCFGCPAAWNLCPHPAWHPRT
jgi:ATP-dependent exoDNAse (exonuclease V) beta subunit